MSIPTVIHWLPNNTAVIASKKTIGAGGGSLVINSTVPGLPQGPFIYDKVIRKVSLTSTTDLSAVNFTITGIGSTIDGNSNPDLVLAPITEVLTGPNTITYSANIYSQITSISTTMTESCLVKQSANLTATYANGAAGVGATLTNSGAQTAFVVDGITVPLNARVLVSAQTTQLQNGIYTCTNQGSGSTNWVLTRATDYDTPTKINRGGIIPALQGTVSAGTYWVETQTITAIGTDAIAFVNTSTIDITLSAGSGNAGITDYVFLDYNRTMFQASLQVHFATATAATANGYQSLTKPEYPDIQYGNLKPASTFSPTLIAGLGPLVHANGSATLSFPASVVWLSVTGATTDEMYFTVLQQGIR